MFFKQTRSNIEGFEKEEQLFLHKAFRLNWTDVRFQKLQHSVLARGQSCITFYLFRAASQEGILVSDWILEAATTQKSRTGLKKSKKSTDNPGNPLYSKKSTEILRNV